MPVDARKAARSRSAEAARRPMPNCISRSPTRIWPRSGSSSRLMQRRSVDLPEPDGPMIATTPPRTTSSETPFKTSTRPKDFHRSAISIIGRVAESNRVAGRCSASRIPPTSPNSASRRKPGPTGPRYERLKGGSGLSPGRRSKVAGGYIEHCCCGNSVGAGELPLDALRQQGQREQHREIEHRDHRIDFERAVGRGGDHLSLIEEVGDRDCRHERRVLQLDDRL